MRSISIASRDHLAATVKPGTMDNLARRLVLNKLNQLKTGHLTVIDGNDEITFGESKDTARLFARIRVGIARSIETLRLVVPLVLAKHSWSAIGKAKILSP